MSEVSVGLLVKELNSRLEAMETQLKAHQAILNSMAGVLHPEQKNILKQALKEKFALAINHGSPGLKSSFENQKKAVETVLGSIG